MLFIAQLVNIIKFLNLYYDYGFKLTVEEKFFKGDIKNQKETKQWLFILER